MTHFQHLDQRINESSQRLQTQQNEWAALQNKKSRLQQQLEAETAQKLTERKQQLEKLEAKYTDDLNGLLEDVHIHQEEKARLDKLIGSAKQELETITTLKRAELEKSAKALYDTETMSQVATKRLQDADTKHADLVKQSNIIQTQLQTLQKQYTDLQTETAELTITKTNLGKRYKSLQAEYDGLLGTIASEKRSLEVQKAELIKEKEQFSLESSFVRKDLANRIGMLDERDANIRRRELRVEQNEATIQQNANLLSL